LAEASQLKLDWVFAIHIVDTPAEIVEALKKAAKEAGAFDAIGLFVWVKHSPHLYSGVKDPKYDHMAVAAKLFFQAPPCFTSHVAWRHVGFSP
jgi:hypothetical protein